MPSKRQIISERLDMANDSDGSVSIAAIPSESKYTRTLLLIHREGKTISKLALTKDGVKELIKFLIDEI